MKASKTKNWFETGYQQLKSGLQKISINIPIRDAPVFECYLFLFL